MILLCACIFINTLIVIVEGVAHIIRFIRNKRHGVAKTETHEDFDAVAHEDKNNHNNGGGGNSDFEKKVVMIDNEDK